MISNKSLLKKLEPLASAKITFFILPWLMVLLIIGTIAQKEIGLFAATEKFFNSFILWLGPVPLPGGLTTVGLILGALTIKFIFFSEWRWKKSGTILTHLGVLLLLVGGLITTTSNYEGFMIIPEGQENSKISDYRKRVLNIYEDGNIIESYEFDNLDKEQTFSTAKITLKISQICTNCGIRPPTENPENLRDLAVNMELYPTKEEKNPEENFSGLALNIETPQKDKNGTYIVMEDIPRNPVFEIEDKKIEIKLEREKQDLPFSITLKDFRKIDYPGTLKAKEFESDLIIQDMGIAWPVTVSMNKPARYKGYTFYQSSFDQRDNFELTVLNVVRNQGRIFPYIATLVIFIGLLIHFVIHLTGKKREIA